MMRRILPLLMLLALLLCACGGSPGPETSAPTEQTHETKPAAQQTGPAPTEETQSAPTEETEPVRLPPVFWEDNMLRQDFLEVLGIPRGQIRTVTFLSIRREAPEDAVELSCGSGSVLGWVREDAQIFIAADRGINGAESAEGLFEGCISLESVTFGDAYRTDLASSLERMFLGCKSLTQADVENLDVSSASHMARLFGDCISLSDPDVSGWDTSSATDMEGMFRGCVSLDAPDLSLWQVEKVVSMEGMFEGCAALRQLELGRWNPQGVETMAAMFRDCAVLRSIGSFPLDHPAIDETTFSGCGLLPH